MYLVSACLAGIDCRYDGGSNENKVIQEMIRRGEALPVCPEQLAGLTTPRTCCEMIGYHSKDKKVMSMDGRDLTKEFADGAEKTLGIAKVMGIKAAILKSKSPSCGCGLIYDGTFSGKTIPGNGVTAELLLKNNIKVYTEQDLEELLKSKIITRENQNE